MVMGDSRRTEKIILLYCGTFFVPPMVCEKSTFSEDLILECTSCKTTKRSRGEIRVERTILQTVCDVAALAYGPRPDKLLARLNVL